MNQEDKHQLDEFGRAKLPKEDSLSKVGVSSLQWPPNFEEFGSLFVLDQRSGLFYEPKSDFFYDPQRKLYYSNAHKLYYRYCEEAWETVEQSELERINALIAPQPSKTTKISIKLKTKIKSSSAKKTTPARKKEPPKVVVPVPQEHAKNINKWNNNNHKTTVTRTKTGDYVCRVCRRKFPTIAKLQHHEEHSELHRENLQKGTTTTSSAIPNAAYTDRAAQRRQLHATTELPNAQQRHTNPAPNETLGHSNIGHQMLQKLGWKPGEGSKVMQKDWERIERIAKQT